ncbi:hypothetical protein Goari_027362, partial [Gossypium aridum]|nr:hypothetical protein [Gossypium aridum]
IVNCGSSLRFRHKLSCQWCKYNCILVDDDHVIVKPPVRIFCTNISDEAIEMKCLGIRIGRVNRHFFHLISLRVMQMQRPLVMLVEKHVARLSLSSKA